MREERLWEFIHDPWKGIGHKERARGETKYLSGEGGIGRDEFNEACSARFLLRDLDDEELSSILGCPA